MAAMPSSSSGSYMQMLMAALKSLGADAKPSQTDASGSALEQAVTAPGNPGSAVTPQMAAVAQQAMPGTNMQGATVAGAMPGAPPVQGQSQLQQALPFLAAGLGGMGGGGADPKQKEMKPKPAFRGQGTPPKSPIGPPAPPMTPASPGASGPGGGGVPSVGMFLASPQGQQLMKQMQNAIGIGAR